MTRSSRLIFRLNIAFVLLAVAASAQSPNSTKTATLKGDQTLEDLALSLYQDKDAADEIRSINGLSPGDQPAPGVKFKLPGEQRQPAISALNMARQSVKKAETEGAEEYVHAKYLEALASLRKARSSCRRARYQLCQKYADETWVLARMAIKESRKLRSGANRFAVSVDHEGATRVEVTEGDKVQVTANDKTVFVKRGHGTKVEPGGVPEKARKILDPPKQVLPFSGSRLLTTSIQFHWKPVDGAAKYVLLIAEDATGRRPVRQVTTSDTYFLLRSSLPDGKYFWFLRTVDSLGLVGKSSPAKSFILSTKKSTGVKIEEPQRKQKEH